MGPGQNFQSYIDFSNVVYESKLMSKIVYIRLPQITQESGIFPCIVYSIRIVGRYFASRIEYRWWIY